MFVFVPWSGKYRRKIDLQEIIRFSLGALAARGDHHCWDFSEANHPRNAQKYIFVRWQFWRDLFTDYCRPIVAVANNLISLKIARKTKREHLNWSDAWGLKPSPHFYTLRDQLDKIVNRKTRWRDGNEGNGRLDFEFSKASAKALSQRKLAEFNDRLSFVWTNVEITIAPVIKVSWLPSK